MELKNKKDIQSLKSIIKSFISNRNIIFLHDNVPNWGPLITLKEELEPRIQNINSLKQQFWNSESLKASFFELLIAENFQLKGRFEKWILKVYQLLDSIIFLQLEYNRWMLLYENLGNRHRKLIKKRYEDLITPFIDKLWEEQDNVMTECIENDKMPGTIRFFNYIHLSKVQKDFIFWECRKN